MEFNGTFFVTIISFLVFVFVMNRILYLPIRKIVTERNIFISDNYDSANINNKKTEEISSDIENSLINAKEDARLKYNELLEQFKEQKTNIITNAQQDSIAKTEQAYGNLNNISNEAKESLKTKMTDIANDIVEKVLGYRSEIQGFDENSVNNILYH